MIPQLIATLRDLVGDHCPSHEKAERGCSTCAGVELLARAEIEPIALLQTDPDYPVSGFLVHVWPDGTGELAARADDRRWGPPVPLQPAP